MKLLNLDLLRNEDKQIEIDGKQYLIPGDLPLSMMFEFMADSQEIENNPRSFETNKKAFENLAKIIQLKSPEITTEFLIQKLNFKQYLALMAFIFSSDEIIENKNIGEQEKKT